MEINAYISGTFWFDGHISSGVMYKTENKKFIGNVLNFRRKSIKLGWMNTFYFIHSATIYCVFHIHLEKYVSIHKCTYLYMDIIYIIYIMLS